MVMAPEPLLAAGSPGSILPRVRAASCRNLPAGFASREKAGNLVHSGECGLWIL
jgi:hypothetical protein